MLLFGSLGLNMTMMTTLTDRSLVRMMVARVMEVMMMTILPSVCVCLLQGGRHQTLPIWQLLLPATPAPPLYHLDLSA